MKILLLILFCYFVPYIVLTLYAWVFFWRHQKECSIYDLLFHTPFQDDKYNACFGLFVRWIPVLNALFMVLNPLLAIGITAYERYLVRLIAWMKDTKLISEVGRKDNGAKIRNNDKNTMII